LLRTIELDASTNGGKIPNKEPNRLLRAAITDNLGRNLLAKDGGKILLTGLSIIHLLDEIKVRNIRLGKVL